MADGICDVCNVRPATVRARVSSNGKSEILELCDVDYRRLARQQQRPSSPLESLFGRRGSLFEDFFSDDFFGGRSVRGDDAEPPAPSGTRRRIHPSRLRARPRTRTRHRARRKPERACGGNLARRRPPRRRARPQRGRYRAPALRAYRERRRPHHSRPVQGVSRRPPPAARSKEGRRGDRGPTT